MRHSYRGALAAVGITLAGGVAGATHAEATDVRVQAHVYSGHAYYQRPYHSYYHRYYYRPGYRHYYYHYPRHRWRDHRKRDFLNCRWVPGEGRVCW